MGLIIWNPFLIAYLALLSSSHLQLMLEAAKHDESLRSDVLKDHPNARFAFNSCIRGKILQKKMPNLHGEKSGKIPLLKGEQIRQVKMIH